MSTIQPVTITIVPPRRSYPKNSIKGFLARHTNLPPSIIRIIWDFATPVKYTAATIADIMHEITHIESERRMWMALHRGMVVQLPSIIREMRGRSRYHDYVLTIREEYARRDRLAAAYEEERRARGTDWGCIWAVVFCLAIAGGIATFIWAMVTFRD